MKKIIKTLKSSGSAKDVKSGYQQGHYDLESSVMECLDLIDYCDADHYVKTEAVMHFLHQ